MLRILAAAFAAALLSSGAAHAHDAAQKPGFSSWEAGGFGGLPNYTHLRGDCENLSHGVGRNDYLGLWKMPLAQFHDSGPEELGPGQTVLVFRCEDAAPCITNAKPRQSSPATETSHAVTFRTMQDAHTYADRIAALRTACGLDSPRPTAAPAKAVATSWTRAEGFRPGYSSPKQFGDGVFYHIKVAPDGGAVSVNVCNTGRSPWRGSIAASATRPTAGRETMALAYLGCQTHTATIPADADGVWVYSERERR